MLAVDKLIVATLRTDPALISLMGITATNPRIYQYYNGNAIINDTTLRGYITYAQTAWPERTQATTGPVYTLAIWANTYPVANQIRERVIALLDCERDPERVLTQDGEVFQPVCIGEHDSAQEDTKFAGISLQFRFGASLV